MSEQRNAKRDSATFSDSDQPSANAAAATIKTQAKAATRMSISLLLARLTSCGTARRRLSVSGLYSFMLPKFIIVPDV